MGRKDRKFYHAKKSAATSATTSTSEYHAPTVSLEDQVFTIGKAKDASKLENVKEVLGKHFATQTWNNGSDDARAFDTSKEPRYIEPNEPPLPTWFIHNNNMDGTIKTEEDPEYKIKSQWYKILTTLFATYHREWRDNVNHWKSNKSRVFAILFQHFLKDLTQRLKSNGRYETFVLT